MSNTFTGRTLIGDALADIGVLGVGRSLTPRDADFALRYLQETIDSWAAERLSMYQVLRTSFVWTANSQSLTIGPTGADLTLDPRPMWLASYTAVRVGQTYETPLTLWTREQWLNEEYKDVTDQIPRAIFMERNVTNNTIYLWPLPDTAFTLWLGTPEAVGTFADLTTSYTFPEGGYREAFRTRMGVKLARPFGKAAMLPELQQEANHAFGRIAALNDLGPPIMGRNDLSHRGNYDIYTDGYSQ